MLMTKGQRKKLDDATQRVATHMRLVTEARADESRAGEIAERRRRDYYDALVSLRSLVDKLAFERGRVQGQAEGRSALLAEQSRTSEVAVESLTRVHEKLIRPGDPTRRAAVRGRAKKVSKSK